MPYLLVAEGDIIHASDALEGVLSRFTEITGARITNAYPPRAIVDSMGKQLPRRQTDRFDAENEWQVSINGKVYSFHNYAFPYEYYYVHRTPSRAKSHEDCASEQTMLYGHGSPYVAMQITANATPVQLACAIESECRHFMNIPKPLLRLAFNNPGALKNPGVEWSHETSEGETHRWICGPKKSYGILIAIETNENPTPFLWLTGYFDRDRATRFIYAMADYWSIEHHHDTHCDIVWGDTILEAVAAAMKFLDRSISDMYMDEDVTALNESFRLRNLLRDAYLHPINPAVFNLSHPSAPPALAAEAKWLHSVAF